MSKKEIVEEELIFGARRREIFWKKFGLISGAFGCAGCLFAAALALSHETPAPVLVPFDPTTGTALPLANVGTISVKETDAVLQSMVFKYVTDRETYNRLDNDLRIQSVVARSTGRARESLREVWSENSEHYPPRAYGENARLDVEVKSVTAIGNNRAQARIVKRLTSNRGNSEGTFLVTLAYNFKPEKARDLKTVWENPFGFSVSEYSVVSERFTQ